MALPWQTNETEPHQYTPYRSDLKPAPNPSVDEREPEDVNEEVGRTNEEEKPARKPRRKRAPNSLTPSVVKRVAEKTVQVQGASEENRKTAAKLLGCENTVVDIVTAVQTGTARFDAMGTVTAIRDADSDIYAALEVSRLTKVQMNQVWTLARALGADIPKTGPSKEMEMIADLTSSVRSGLDDERIGDVGKLLEVN